MKKLYAMGGALLILATMMSGQAAQAEEPSPPPISSPVTHASEWSEERMAAAVEEELVIPGPEQSTRGTQVPLAIETDPYKLLAAIALPITPAYVDRDFTSTVGKLFLHDPVLNKDSSCTASTISSPSRTLIITAGHCVYNNGA